MEVRFGGNDRYGASRYPVPSTGAVNGVSSTELLVVLCGYWFCSAGPCFWSGQAFYFFCVFSCRFESSLSACAFGQSEVFVPSSVCVVVVVPGCRSPAGWFVPSRASGANQRAVSIAIGTPHVHRMSSGVSVSVSVSGPVGLGLGFTSVFLFRPAFNECGRGEGVSLSSYCLVLLRRASAVAHSSACNCLMSG